MSAMPLIDGICSRSSAITARLAMSRALQIQSSGVVPDAEGASRLEEVTVLTLSLLTGGMIATVERSKRCYRHDLEAYLCRVGSFHTKQDDETWELRS